MKLAVSFYVVLYTSVLALVFTAQAQTIFIAGNNAAANDIRKELVKGAGKKHGRANYCLTVVADPAAADYRAEVAEDRNSRDGFAGVAPVSVTLNTKAGVLVDAFDSRLGSARMPSLISKAVCKEAK